MKRTAFILTAVLLGALASCTSTEELVGEADVLYKQKKYSEAVPLLQEAAERGDAQAQLLLAKCYDFSQGVPHDMAQAVRWYTAAAQQGNSNAMDNLGTCYITGQGVAKNEATA